jgi:hypothetical protein
MIAASLSARTLLVPFDFDSLPDITLLNERGIGFTDELVLGLCI